MAIVRIAHVCLLITMAVPGATLGRASSPVSVQDVDIRVAIDDGIARVVEPYQLRPLGGVNGELPGVVFTPHVRIARLARERHLAGETVSPEDVPEHLREPVVYVVMRQPGVPPEAPSAPAWIVDIVRPPNAPLPSDRSNFLPIAPRRIPALRVEPAAVAKRILGALPFDDDDIADVGVFPLSSVQRPFVEFCVYREYYKLPDDRYPSSIHAVQGWVAGPLR